MKELITKLSRNQETHFKNLIEFWIFYFWKYIEDNPLPLSCENRLPGCLSMLELTKIGATKIRTLLGIQLGGYYYSLLLFFFVCGLCNSAVNTSEHTSSSRRWRTNNEFGNK